MSTNFPTSLDSLTNPTPTDYLNSPSHAGQHANANDAIEAIQAKVGIDGSAVTTSHDYKLSLISGTSRALPNSYLDTDTSLAANSDSKIATQKATKTYADKKLKYINGASNIIAAWGTFVGTPNSSGFLAVTFSSAFPSTCIGVIFANGDGLAAPNVTLGRYGNPTKTGFNLICKVGNTGAAYTGAIRIDYIAFGT